MFGGGGAGGVPSRLSRINKPRFTGEVRVGFLPSAALELVPAVVRAAREAHPGLRLRLLELLDESQLEGLGTGRLDVGLLRTPRPDDELTFEPARLVALADAR